MIISQTPLRISFIGGGTDFEDFYKRYPGRVLSTTINKYFYVFLNRRFDGLIHIRYSENELVKTVDEIKHPLVKAALKKVGIKKAIDIVSLADLPAKKTGLGLGASSAFTVGLLNVLYSFRGKNKSPEFLAEAACEIEINKALSPIGKQDQYAVAFGGLNLIHFFRNNRVTVESIYLPPQIKTDFRNHLLLFFTKRERSANVILEQQKKNIAQKFNSLKKLSEMVLVFRKFLEKGNFRKLGELLHQSWLIKRELAEGISIPEIDKIYNLALKNGAWGGKILGAGGGGFLLIMAPPEKHNKIKQALKPYNAIPFDFSESGSKIIFRN